MAQTVRLTRVNQTTVVEIFVNGELDRQIAVNDYVEFIDDQTGRIKFPHDSHLDLMVLKPDTLHADTVTLLGSPTNTDELFTALVTNKIFNPHVA